MATLNVGDLNRQGKVFTASNVSAKALTAVGTGMTGVILFNPIGSGRVAVIVDGAFAPTTEPTGVFSVGWAMVNQGAVALSGTGVTTLAGSGALQADGTGNTGKILAFDAATVVAVTARRWFANSIWTTGTTSQTYNPVVDRVDGSLIVQPGVVIALCSLTTAVTGVGSITWAEVNV